MLQNIYYYGLGGLSIIAEIFLLVAIPKAWSRKEFTILDKWILIALIFLIVFFVTATLLDPKYQFWLQSHNSY